MLVECCGFKTEIYPDWLRAIRGDVYPTVPQDWGGNRVPDKANDRVQDQKCEYYPNDDCTIIFQRRYAARSGLPHSRQNAFERGVINPQDGHILCVPKPAICGFTLTKRSDALSFLNERVMKVDSV